MSEYRKIVRATCHIMTEVNLKETFEEIKTIKKKLFKRTVLDKVRKKAFQNLVDNIKSKGQEITFGLELKCQGYLLPN